MPRRITELLTQEAAGNPAALRPAGRIAAVLALFLAASLAVQLGGLGGAGPDTVAEQLLSTAVYVLAATLAGLRAWKLAGNRAAWWAITAGVVCCAAGFIASSMLERGSADSIADDLLWLAAYPAFYVGLVLLVKPRVRGFPSSAWLDGMIAGFGAAALAIVALMPPFSAIEGFGVHGLAAYAYPLSDLLLMLTLLTGWAFGGWRPGPAWWLLGCGFLALLLGDAGYLLSVIDHGTVGPGFAEQNVLWEAAVFLMAAAAWFPSHRVGERRTDWLDWPALVVPSVFTAVSVAVLALYDTGERPVACALAIASIAASVGRTALTFRELRILTEESRLAMVDQLTGLPNRRALFIRLGHQIEHARACGGHLALLLFDLDHFKDLNDTLGHQAGDMLLEQIGPRLEPIAAETEIVARMGGDEFAILLPATESSHEETTEHATDIARRARELIGEPFMTQGLKLHVDTSVGVAVAGPEDVDADTLLKHADVAMYRAKGEQTGVEAYAAELDPHSVGRLELMAELPDALKSGQLVPYYQPQADLRTGRVTSVEALLRWQHPSRTIAPDEFLPHAEQAGLMGPLTEHVLRVALRDALAWRGAGHDVGVAVNLAAPNLLDVGLPDAIRRVLDETGAPASLLTLEITEGTVMNDPELSLEILAGLCELGVGLSLDDFGKGYSSLAQLKRLPVTELKIDRDFAMGMDEADAAIVRSTIALAHSLGLTVVTEGVESAETWAALTEFGSDRVQGYHLSRPIPADDVEAWLREHEATAVTP